MKKNFIKVLNLIISGLPSILSTVAIVLSKLLLLVLNLIINGLPSIHTKTFEKIFKLLGFKPYYKWITFNTERHWRNKERSWVLNLIINGLPSILTFLITIS